MQAHRVRHGYAVGRRRPAARRHRGYRVHIRRHREEFRQGDRESDRGRHKARQNPVLLARGAAGGKPQENADGDVGGYPRHHHQVCGPHAQPLHARVRLPAEAARQGARVPRGVRADRPPARHAHRQGIYGGRLAEVPRPGRLPRDRGEPRGAQHAAQAVRRKHKGADPQPRGAADPRRVHRGARQEHQRHLPQDVHPGQRASTRSTTCSRCASSSTRSSTATTCSASCTTCSRRCRTASRTIFRRRSRTCTSRCTRPSSARRASRSRCRSAPGRCTTPPNTALRRTGNTSSA